MCGIAGIVKQGGSDREVMKTMLDTMRHRGPDHSAIFQDRNMLLGHLRLSIIDLKSGNQPIFNEDQTLGIIYNGELYNYRELAKVLKGLGHVFKTMSDTEVILHGYEEYGTEIFNRLNGMFAFAIFDLKDESILLARDHFGIKPLHYYWKDSTFIFASEQKAILQHKAVDRLLDFESLHLHLNLRYTPGAKTLFQGIKRLPPAHFALYKSNNLHIEKYWSPEIIPNHELSEDEAIIGINHHLKKAVQRQLVSDVPIGVYLSGGLDSSAIVQKMHELHVEEINTFTLGFNEPTDEFSDAQIIAKKFGTNHRELSLENEPLKKDFRKVIWHAEEPKINLLQGFNMSGFVSRHLKVVLGGLGGDEIFAGYDIHKFIYPTNHLHKRVPRFLKRLFRWKSDFLFKLQNGSKKLRYDEYRRGLQMLLAIGQIERYYLILRNVWDIDRGAFRNIYSEKHIRTLKNYKVADSFSHSFERWEKLSPIDQVFRVEMETKMIDDYLLVEDRMSMAHSVEERVPYLDRDLVEFAMRIPVALKMKHGKTKFLFRKSLRHVLPPRIIEKKKWGFTANPYLQFKKDLKIQAEKHLTKEYIEKQGIFNYNYIRHIIDSTPHPRMRWHYNLLWIILGFAIWEDVFSIGGTRLNS